MVRNLAKRRRRSTAAMTGFEEGSAKELRKCENLCIALLKAHINTQIGNNSWKVVTLPVQVCDVCCSGRVLMLEYSILFLVKLKYPSHNYHDASEITQISPNFSDLLQTEYVSALHIWLLQGAAIFWW